MTQTVATAPALPRWDVVMPDLTGRLAVVTGSTGGIGLEAVSRLGAAGAEVVMVARDEARATRLAHRLRQAIPHGAFRIEYADLADLNSVHALANRLLDQNRPLSMLINNAGIMLNRQHRESVDGFELQFAVNHLAPFALTGLLLPLLRLAARPRVIALGSLTANRARIDFASLHRPRGGAYPQSKLAQLLFTAELDRRSRAQRWGVEALAAHPGYAATGIVAGGIGRMSQSLGIAQSAAEGALPVLVAATDPYARGGSYYGPQHRLGLTGPPGLVRMPRVVPDRAIAHDLWVRSEELTGVHWPRAIPTES